MRKFLIGFIMGIALMIPVTAFGQTAVEKIEALLRPDINVQIDGELVELNDSPILYNGRTYLPLREMGENVLGMEVDWIGETSTAVLTTPQEISVPEMRSIEGEKVDSSINFDDYGYGEFYNVDESLSYAEVVDVMKNLQGRIESHETYIRASEEPNPKTSFDPNIVQAFRDELVKMNNVLPQWEALRDKKAREEGIYDELNPPTVEESTETE